jgi:hypothetical protein
VRLSAAAVAPAAPVAPAAAAVEAPSKVDGGLLTQAAQSIGVGGRGAAAAAATAVTAVAGLPVQIGEVMEPGPGAASSSTVGHNSRAAELQREFVVPYDLLIGADGSNSRVRAELEVRRER